MVWSCNILLFLVAHCQRDVCDRVFGYLLMYNCIMCCTECDASTAHTVPCTIVSCRVFSIWVFNIPVWWCKILLFKCWIYIHPWFLYYAFQLAGTFYCNSNSNIFRHMIRYNSYYYTTTVSLSRDNRIISISRWLRLKLKCWLISFDK